MPRKAEIFCDGENSWDITRLLRKYPELLCTKNCTIKLDTILGQRKKIWLLPSKREPDLKKPILILRSGSVIDGWHRIELALELKRKTLPAIILNEEQENYALCLPKESER